MSLVKSGVHYCVVHAGVCEEDQEWCDFAPDDENPKDDGEPRECLLRPLFYEGDQALTTLHQAIPLVKED